MSTVAVAGDDMAFVVTERWTFRNVLWDLRRYYFGQAASYFEKVVRA